jgi:A/G-specific adenine glycosylase
VSSVQKIFIADSSNSKRFQQSVVSWFRLNARDLLWRKTSDPYRIWISEVMLQQTQVTTVIPYFQRFITAFPTIIDLANAHPDQVLHLWSGLGYYARGRNLHKAAQMIRDQFNGEFPTVFEDIIKLPGVGRSTAGAIVSIAFNQRYAILDGNVKRVLSRFEGISGYPAETQVANTLWTTAEKYTPSQRTADYTQAIMDLGATVCIRNKPKCAICPLNSNCQAFLTHRIAEFPGKKPKKNLPIKQTTLLIIRDPDDNVLLEQRPPTGIWGGLWSFPELAEDTPTTWCQRQGLNITTEQTWPSFRHTFSHYHLDITPVIVNIMSQPYKIMESGRFIWYNLNQPDARGLSAPVSKLLESLSCPV